MAVATVPTPVLARNMPSTPLLEFSNSIKEDRVVASDSTLAEKARTTTRASWTAWGSTCKKDQWNSMIDMELTHALHRSRYFTHAVDTQDFAKEAYDWTQSNCNNTH